MKPEITQKPAGYYLLPFDVANPHPDGRVRHDWALLSVFPAGTKFIIEHENMWEDLDRSEEEREALRGKTRMRVRRVKDSGDWHTFHINDEKDAERWNAMAKELISIRETDVSLCLFLAKNDGENITYEILDELRQAGKVTDQDIANAIRSALSKIQ